MRKGKEERNVRKELFWKVPSGGTNDLLARDPFDDCFFDASGFSGGFFSWVYVCKTVPFFLLIACINPAFNHYGVTELFRLKTGPVTLEAIVYGLVLAFVLYISVLWFSSFHEIMTTDRFVYLFGKLSPDISLVLSMAMRFVPRFTKQLKKIRMGTRKRD